MDYPTATISFPTRSEELCVLASVLSGRSFLKNDLNPIPTLDRTHGTIITDLFVIRTRILRLLYENGVQNEASNLLFSARLRDVCGKRYVQRRSSRLTAIGSSFQYRNVDTDRTLAACQVVPKLRLLYEFYSDAIE